MKYKNNPKPTNAATDFQLFIGYLTFRSFPGNESDEGGDGSSEESDDDLPEKYKYFEENLDKMQVCSTL